MIQDAQFSICENFLLSLKKCNLMIVKYVFSNEPSFLFHGWLILQAVSCFQQSDAIHLVDRMQLSLALIYLCVNPYLNHSW